MLFCQMEGEVVYLHTLRHKLANPDAIDWAAFAGK